MRAFPVVVVVSDLVELWGSGEVVRTLAVVPRPEIHIPSGSLSGGFEYRFRCFVRCGRYCFECRVVNMNNGVIFLSVHMH